jgi:hypothetical protein
MAKQRSRIDRLKDGDRNTALYHAKARERGRTNAIKSLVRDDGSVAETQEELEEVAVSYNSTRAYSRNKMTWRWMISCGMCSGR